MVDSFCEIFKETTKIVTVQTIKENATLNEINGWFFWPYRALRIGFSEKFNDQSALNLLHKTDY